MSPDVAKYTIVYHHRTKDTDGQRVHIREIQDCLRALGHTVVEVSPVSAAESAGEAPVASPARRVLEGLARRLPRVGTELMMLGYNLVSVVALLRAVRRHRPHFIYERYAANAVAGGWVSRLTGIPLILEANSPLADEQARLGKLTLPGVARWLERRALRGATVVLPVTKVLAERLIGSASLDPGSVSVVQNGANPEVFDRALSMRDVTRQRLGVGNAIVVGAVAFFLPWHGIEALLEVPSLLGWLRSGRVRLLLVGDGPAVPGIRAAAERLGITGSLVFTGAVPHRAVAPLVAAMDVVVLPQVVDYASPLKLFEYMAAGRPIVAPRQANLLEVLTEGTDALCFAPSHLGEMAAALERLVEDEPLRARLGQAARRTLDARDLTWIGNARRIVATYEGLPAPARAGARG